MNKIIVLALSLIFIISTGCATEDSSSNINTSSENQSKPSLAPNLNEKSHCRYWWSWICWIKFN